MLERVRLFRCRWFLVCFVVSIYVHQLLESLEAQFREGPDASSTRPLFVFPASSLDLPCLFWVYTSKGSNWHERHQHIRSS